MVLDQEDAAITEPLGLADIVDELAIALAVAARAAALCPGAAEETEFHAILPKC